MRTSVTVLLATLIAGSVNAATIDVKVVDASGSPVPEVVAYAVPDTPIPVGHKVAVMDQKDRMFLPHILAIQTGTWVEFPNSDDIRHQVYSLSPTKRFQLPLYKGKPAFPIQFSKSGIVALGCNIHDQMSAYLVVVDTPYFALAEAGGASLQVGVGAYTVRVWYPAMREEPKPQRVTVGANDRSTMSFVVKK